MTVPVKPSAIDRAPLAATEARFRAMAESAPIGIFLTLPNGECTYANPWFTQRLGWASSDFMGIGWAGTVHPEDVERVFRLWVDRTSSGAVYEDTFRFVHRDDGSVMWASVRATAVREGAQAVGYVGTAIDITESRQAREQLEYQAHIQRAITENAVSGLLLVNDKGHTTYLNPAAQRILGFELADLTPLTLHDALHHSRPDGTRIAPEDCEYFQAFIRGEEVRNANEWLIRKDGTFFPASVAATPLFRDGKLAGAVYEFHDITEQHRAWEALREADRRKDQFLAILGHELRNPIATIQNAMEVINRRPADDPEAQRMRAIVLRQSEHLHRLVDDLLDVARVQTGKIGLARGRVDLRDVATTVIDAARTAGKLARHEVSLRTPAEPLVVEGDRARLEQLLGNFLDNAVKFTPEGRAVRVTVEARGGEGAVTVEDEGRGIDPESLSKLFHLFAQADQPIDRPLGGLGVGLALARAIAELHGGTVSAASPGPGLGSTFTVTLPLADAAAPAVTSRAAPPRPRSRRVVVVEDNADARAALAALLEEEGHAVTAFASGRDAVAHIPELRPDVAFIDLGLPEMDGFAVARALRANVGGAIRLVALTGYGQPNDVERALRAGFDSHLTKPAGVDQLNAAIAGS